MVFFSEQLKVFSRSRVWWEECDTSAPVIHLLTRKAERIYSCFCYVSEVISDTNIVFQATCRGFCTFFFQDQVSDVWRETPSWKERFEVQHHDEDCSIRVISCLLISELRLLWLAANQKLLAWARVDGPRCTWRAAMFAWFHPSPLSVLNKSIQKIKKIKKTLFPQWNSGKLVKTSKCCLC